jgi:ABC-type transport system substrate-binding protein
MERSLTNSQHAQVLNRRDLLKAGLAAGVTLSAWPLYSPHASWAGEAGPPKRGGILRVRGIDPPHFEPHLTIAPDAHGVLSFVYSRLVRHKVGAGVQPGTFPVEPDLAARWEALDDTTYVFYLRKESSGTINLPSMAVNWWPRISNSPMSAS